MDDGHIVRRMVVNSAGHVEVIADCSGFNDEGIAVPDSFFYGREDGLLPGHQVVVVSCGRVFKAEEPVDGVGLFFAAARREQSKNQEQCGE